jgi:FtsP/CotA-like multicopper oxidase with cupredoxin domain
MTTNTISRRNFIVGGIVAGGVFVVGGAATQMNIGWAAKPGGGGTIRYPLRRLDVVNPGALRAQSGTVSIGPRTVAGLLYNGALPGPVFVVNRGDHASIPFENRLAEPTTVHWHGLVVPTAMDGQPQDPIAPGASYTYAFDVNQRAGLSFFHPHPDMATSSQVALGLAGGFLIRDAEEAALGLPAGSFEVPLVLRDANYDRTGNLSYNGTASGFTGKSMLVNGVQDPYLSTSPAVHRLRVVGGSNSRVFTLALSNGDPLTVIGNDGGLLPAPAKETEVVLSPGERLDLLVDLRTSGGKTVSLIDRSSGWNLLEFRVDNSTPQGSMPTGTLSTIERLSNPVGTRTFSFDGMTRINGQLFELDRIDFQVNVGDVEQWTFTTNGNAPHPVHIHGASFQVVSRSGGRGRLYSWEQGWKDTVLLNDGETVTVLIRFDLAGRYLMHCHKLEHEDAGMMLNFQVVNPTA